MILDVWNLTCVSLTFPVLQVEDELNSPVVVFRFSQETSAGEWLTLLFLFQHIFLNQPRTLIQLHPTYFRCNVCIQMM